jgi:hypothetical protein
MRKWLHLNENSSLLIGNINQHRTSWIIISVLSGLRESAPTLFDVRPKIPEEMRAAVFERDNHRCQKCGRTEDLTLDHIIPWSKCYRHEINNLRVLCRSCNSRRGDQMEDGDMMVAV